MLWSLLVLTGQGVDLGFRGLGFRGLRFGVVRHMWSF